MPCVRRIIPPSSLRQKHSRHGTLNPHPAPVDIDPPGEQRCRKNDHPLRGEGRDCSAERQAGGAPTGHDADASGSLPRRYNRSASPVDINPQVPQPAPSSANGHLAQQQAKRGSGTTGRPRRRPGQAFEARQPEPTLCVRALRLRGTWPLRVLPARERARRAHHVSWQVVNRQAWRCGGIRR